MHEFICPSCPEAPANSPFVHKLRLPVSQSAMDEGLGSGNVGRRTAVAAYELGTRLG